MVQQDSPQVPPAGERRRAERVRPGPLRVRLQRSEGILIDISGLGALVRLPLAQAPDKQLTLQLEWKDKTVKLPARAVRSTPHRVELPTAVLARTEHHVAVEFRGLSKDAAAALTQIIREHSGEQR
jgi:hypothetical protein